MNGIFLTDTKNYLKRDTSSGSGNLPAPTAASAWFNRSVAYVVNHDLGYIPQIRVYYEPYADGFVYPATGRRVSNTGVGLRGLSTDIICLWEADANRLIIYLESANVQSGTRPVYWVIYRDS